MAISATSGVAGIAYWINTHYHLKGSEAVDKKDPAVLAVKKWVDAQYEGGRQTVISDDELVKQVALLNDNRFVEDTF